MTKSIPNYVCITCGRGFTTAAAGRRHVANVESGKGYIVTEAEYRTKLVKDMIPVPISKSVRQFRQTKKLLEIADEEFLRGYYHRMGELKCEEEYKPGKYAKKLADIMHNKLSTKELIEVEKALHSEPNLITQKSSGEKLNTFLDKLAQKGSPTTK